MERTFDGVILKNKIEEFIVKSRNNINTTLEKIFSFLSLMKEENENLISKSNSIFYKYNLIIFSYRIL